jgi:hypothetical protein
MTVEQRSAPGGAAAGRQGGAAAGGRDRAARPVVGGTRGSAGAAPDDARHLAERDHLLARLTHLRTIVPVFAQELAGARRAAAQPRVENRPLLERIRELQQSRRRPGASRR